MKSSRGEPLRTLVRAGDGFRRFFLPEHGSLRFAPFSVVAVLAIFLGLGIGSMNFMQQLEWSLYNRYVDM